MYVEPGWSIRIMPHFRECFNVACCVSSYDSFFRHVKTCI